MLKAKLARNKQGNDTWKKIKKQKQQERLRKQRAIRVEEEKNELHKEKERRKKEAEAWLSLRDYPGMSSSPSLGKK